MLKIIALIFIGGGTGSTIRYLINLSISYFIPSFYFPIPTLLINVLGSFLIGICLGLNSVINQELFLFITIGILGGFTTFSTFSLQSIELIIAKKYLIAISYISLSVMFSLIFTGIGIKLGNIIDS